MPETRLIVMADGCVLPDVDENREQLLEDINAALAQVLSEYQAIPDRIRIFDGDVYSSVDDRCPECGKQLRLRRVEPDTSNGATAPASCECGWNGDVVYRIIDIVENLHENPMRVFYHPDSVVEMYDIDPLYVPHTNASQYSFRPPEPED